MKQRQGAHKGLKSNSISSKTRFRATALGLCAALALFGCASEHTEDVLDENGDPWQEGELGVWTPGLSVAAAGGCSTGIVAGLAAQLVAEINCLRPNTLSSYAHARIRNGANVTALLQTPAARGIEAVAGARNATLNVNSALRTLPAQYLLYRWYREGRCGIGLAASPGNSNHESGLAVDVQDNAGWRNTFEGRSWRWLGANDPVHFDFRGNGTVSLSGLSVRAFQRLWNRNNAGDQIAEDGAYGPQTEARLRQSPTEGFPRGACEAAPPVEPDPPPPVDAVVEVFSRWITIEGQARDLVPTGSSAGIFDVLTEQTFEAVVEVRNGAGRPATDAAVVGYSWLGADFSLRSRVVETDAPAFDGATWRAVDGSSLEAPPGSDLVTVGVLAPRERRRIRFVAQALRPAVGGDARIKLRGWVKHIANYYGEQDAWDDAVESNGAGRLLRHEGVLDAFGRDRWTFNGPDPADLEGFVPCNGAGSRVVDGALALGGCAASPPWTSVDADSLGTLLIDTAAGAGGTLRVRWGGGGEGSVEVAVPAAASSLSVDLAGQPGWTGTITSLVFEGDVGLDQVAFGPAMAPEPPPPDPERDGGIVDPPFEDAGLPPVEGVDRGVSPEPLDGFVPLPERDAGELVDFGYADGFVDEVPADASLLTGGCSSSDGPGVPARLLALTALFSGLVRRRRRR